MTDFPSSTDREQLREMLAAAWMYGHCRARGFTFAETDIPGCKGSFLWGQAAMDAVALMPEPSAAAQAAPEPFAWVCELAHDIDANRQYCDWREYLSKIKPMVPEASIRNLRPLYLDLAYAEKEPAKPEPTRWPTKGDWMTFLGKNGYDHELTEALRIFKVGQQYRVLECNVQSWSHSVRFEDVVGWYNGVMFERTSELPSTPRATEAHPDCPCKPGKCIYPHCTCAIPPAHRGDAAE